MSFGQIDQNNQFGSSQSRYSTLGLNTMEPIFPVFQFGQKIDGWGQSMEKQSVGFENSQLIFFCSSEPKESKFSLSWATHIRLELNTTETTF